LHILVIEDETKISDLLKRGIESAEPGCSVSIADTGAAALDLLHGRVYDLIILDLMLPDFDGMDLLSKIRNRRVTSPVLILSARDGLSDRVKGLESGADDYLVKPFAFVELMARIRALARRGVATPEKLQVGDLVLDCIRRRVTRAGQVIELAPKEFAILEYMMRNRGRPLSRTMIVEHVWDLDYDGLTNIVDVYIRHLRTKIDSNFPVRMIQTIRGVGYLLDATEPSDKAEAPEAGETVRP
jgi:DNA-binding response OmpR family regulator